VKSIIAQVILFASLASVCITSAAGDARMPNTCPTLVTASAVPSGTAQERPKEIAVQTIPLVASPPLQPHGKDELSGLAWHKDHLILLPELKHLNTVGASDGYLFRIAKADILDFLDGKSSLPLKIQRIPFRAAHITKQINGYQGFEAIVFKDDRVYMTIEAEPGPDGRMMAYLVSGRIKPNSTEVQLDNEFIELPPPAEVGNASYESLMLMDNRLVSFFELNGTEIKKNHQGSPRGRAFSLSPRLTELEPTPLPNIEYRITDATVADGDGKFWVINYYFPCEVGRNKYEIGIYTLAQTYGRGATHAERKQVERLVEFQYVEQEGRIKLTKTPPIQLKLEDRPRNWEGLVRLDQRGFLIVTDEHPETILGFVPYP